MATVPTPTSQPHPSSATNPAPVSNLRRWFQHLWPLPTAQRALLREDSLMRVTQAIADSEHSHSGEIRVCIEAQLSPSHLWNRCTARQQAIEIFSQLRVWDTEHNNGVLVYMLLAERSIEIVADRGLNGCVDPGDWHTLVASMREAFQVDRYEEGLLLGVQRIGALLTQHWPLEAGVGEISAKAANPNELPDRPWVI